ncbi:hypothetical protein EP47_04905 [Legionella norrlandica]|uniref:L,D-TPase catalytic domain-containing protein n=1 Tax=Legionella norrlandica TaxID=1498499 RepID=A0A0A2SRE7_9GAMM|nr:L,D-transpeptidase [Legionella norrlandica]KGP63705.1 hypothetical protein EP47_04905 [Legionella norrlandica]
MIQKYILLLSFCIYNNTIQANSNNFAKQLCQQSQYKCLKVKKSNSWSQLFPNPRENDLVKKINRTNEFLSSGMILAVPRNLHNTTILDVSPFPLILENQHEKVILISLKLLAWAAFSADGRQVNWGPISAGSIHCPELLSCATPKGTFRIQRKRGLDCYSKSFPQMISGEKGGAYMPYCMYFYKGYALHGSENLPGYNASHGCVRLFNHDAQWLNEYFVELPNHKQKNSGTKVIISD